MRLHTFELRLTIHWIRLRRSLVGHWMERRPVVHPGFDMSSWIGSLSRQHILLFYSPVCFSCWNCCCCCCSPYCCCCSCCPYCHWCCPCSCCCWCSTPWKLLTMLFLFTIALFSAIACWCYTYAGWTVCYWCFHSWCCYFCSATFALLLLPPCCCCCCCCCCHAAAAAAAAAADLL